MDSNTYNMLLDRLEHIHFYNLDIYQTKVFIRDRRVVIEGVKDELVINDLDMFYDRVNYVVSIHKNSNTMKVNKLYGYYMEDMGFDLSLDDVIKCGINEFGTSEI